MQRKRNIRLLIIFTGLLIINLAVIFLDNELSVENSSRYKFTLIDTSQVNKITLKQPEEVVVLQKNGKVWEVNGKYKMDERMLGLIFAVMTSVETSRPVTTSGHDDLKERLLKEGVLVRFYSNEEVISEFYTGGDLTKTNSYMMRGPESVPYVVYIPGYSSYLAGLFELKASDWRSKKAFETSWSSLKSLRLESSKDNSVRLAIDYEGNFFKVANVPRPDTVKMMDYLETVTNLWIDRYIEPGQSPVYDSVITVGPEFNIFMEDVDESKNRQLQIYPKLAGDDQRLGKLLPSGQIVGIRERKIQDILAENRDFEASFKLD